MLSQVEARGSAEDLQLATRELTTHALREGARRFLFAVLLAASVVPPGIGQTSNPENPKNVLLSLDGAPAMGDPKARVAIVEFGDYQCPYCGQHANQTLPQIVTDYVKTGKVRYFFRDTPVKAIHPQAFKTAEPALCAGEQGKHWEMHDRLFKNQEALAVNELAAHAGALGLDVPQIPAVLFFVGMLDPQESGKKAVTTLSRFKPYSSFQQALDQMLSPGEQKESANETNAYSPSRPGPTLWSHGQKEAREER